MGVLAGPPILKLRLHTNSIGALLAGAREYTGVNAVSRDIVTVTGRLKTRPSVPNSL